MGIKVKNTDNPQPMWKLSKERSDLFMGEKQWKTINKFKNIPDNKYQVSKFGDVRIKSTKKMVHRKIANKKYHPYYAVYLHNIEGKGEWILVHQLVAFCFCKIPDKYKGKILYAEVVPDHLDNNGLNNYYKNLEWKTRGENVKKAMQCKEINTTCENHRDSLITNQQAHMICKYLELNYSYADILQRMGFPNDKSHRTLLVRIKNRLAWTEISSGYKFDSSSIKYRKSQMDSIDKIPKMQELYSEGMTYREIARVLWGPNINTRRLDTKSAIVKNILQGKIYKELLQGSSTRES